MFVALAIAAQVGIASASCSFEYEEWWCYTCTFSGAVVNNENDILDFSGEHIGGRTNANVDRVVFINSQMQTIPSNVFDVFPRLITLEANGVGINRLNVGTLRNSNLLGEIYLNNNTISRLDNGVFRNAGNLRVLRINDNRLNFIGENVFRDLSALQNIQLNGNQLTEIPEKLFQNSASLRNIGLSENLISRITPGLFSGIGSLLSVGLNSNLITDIPAEAFLGLRIANLDLSNNLISTIGTRAFGEVGSTSTRSGGLVLGGNRITRLSSDMFGVQSNLVFLDVENNQINAIERNFFTLLVSSFTFNAQGNVCVNQRFSLTSTTQIAPHLEGCFANF